MAPLPPAMLGLKDAIEMTANALNIGKDLAANRLLDALCDGAFHAVGGFRTAEGPPRCLTVAPANWQMYKYSAAEPHYDFIEIRTVDLIKWLRLDVRPDRGRAIADRSGLPFPPTKDKALIRKCVLEVYEKARLQSVRPPNLEDLPKCVNQLLERLGLRATKALVQEVGNEPDIRPYRPTQGSHPDPKLRPLSELKL